MGKPNSFNVHDGSINVWTEVRDDWDAYRAIREILKEAGYCFHADPKIKKRYPSLMRTHHAGSRKDVHFVSHIYPAGFQFEFYEDVIRDNPNGGRYHFDKMQKMPYLRRLAVLATHRKIRSYLEDQGYSDGSHLYPDDSMEFIRVRRAEIEEFHGPHFYAKPVESYNGTDADGACLQDGDLRYFRSYSGHLLRGPIYHNLNMMWWVAVSPFEAVNVAAHDLFTYDGARQPAKEALNVKRRMESKLAQAVKRQDFERELSAFETRWLRVLREN